jgi:hypothetical protein
MSLVVQLRPPNVIVPPCAEVPNSDKHQIPKSQSMWSDRM